MLSGRKGGWTSSPGLTAGGGLDIPSPRREKVLPSLPDKTLGLVPRRGKDGGVRPRPSLVGMGELARMLWLNWVVSEDPRRPTDGRVGIREGSGPWTSVWDVRDRIVS